MSQFNRFLLLSSQCGRPFSADDVVMINVGEDEEKVQRQAMEEKRRQARLAKVSRHYNYCGTVHTCC